MKFDLDFDIYKLSIVALFLVVVIVGAGIYFGVSGQGSQQSNASPTAKAQTDKAVPKTDNKTSNSAKENTAKNPPPPATPKSKAGNPAESVDKSTLKYRFDPEKNFLIGKYKGPTYEPLIKNDKHYSTVYLTIEDGSNAGSVEKVLKLLKDKNIKLTMFVTGEALLANAELWKKAANDGHQICNHSFSHKDMRFMNDLQMAQEVWKWEEAANIVLGEEYVTNMKKKFPFFKAPDNIIDNNPRRLKVISALGYRPVGWTIETYHSVLNKNPKLSAEDKAKEVFKYLTKNTKAGNIVSLTFSPEDLTYLEQTIYSFNNRGLKIRVLSDGFPIK